MHFPAPSTLSTFVIPLTLLAACSEPKEPVSTRGAPASLTETAPAALEPSRRTAARRDAGVAAGKAPNAAVPRTLLEEEALFHDELRVDWRTRGDQLRGQGRAGEAVMAYRKALFDAPDASTWRALGESYLTAGEAARGIACLEEALRTEPTLIAARARLVRAYLEGDAKRARAHAEVVARAQPESAKAHYELGRVYMKLSMWNEAVSSFERSLAIEPTSSYAHNNLGYSALQVGRDELALQHLEATLDLTPQTPYMMNNLGLAYERQGRGPDALAAYLRAVEMKPGYINAVVNKDRMKAQLSVEERAVALDILEELKSGPVAGATTASIEAKDGESR